MHVADVCSAQLSDIKEYYKPNMADEDAIPYNLDKLTVFIDKLA